MLLTDRPDNRRPLDWERNQVDLLMMEGRVFECPWTGKSLRRAIDYDLDHLLPVSVYPINELWNLAPTDRRFNQHVKRDRLPTHDLLVAADRDSSSHTSTTPVPGSSPTPYARTPLLGLRAPAQVTIRISSQRLSSIFWIAQPMRPTWLGFLEDRMTRRIYDKLVRDRIPEIIRQSGGTCGSETFWDHSAFRRALRDKLIEEAGEAANASEEDPAAELADLREVIDALIIASGLNSNLVRTLQEQRRVERGAFVKRLRLLWTE
jgi:predicted house-cleaning noncanonical NTP pyrophosphatase (MazG superfamily)